MFDEIMYNFIRPRDLHMSGKYQGAIQVGNSTPPYSIYLNFSNGNAFASGVAGERSFSS